MLLLTALCLLYHQPPKIMAFPQQPDIYLEVYRADTWKKKHPKVYFLSPHENEKVANAYMIRRVDDWGGTFLVLRQHGERNLKLRFQGQVYLVDPNRIFTRRGAEQSIQNLNPELDPHSRAYRRAVKRAENIGKFIKKKMNRLRRNTVVITLHNNTDGYDDDGKGGVGTVSIDRYRKKLAAGAAFLESVFEGSQDEDDLFFINRRSDYELMAGTRWNVVLQHPQVADLEDEDDGSLSVLCEMKDLRYINIEAQRNPDHLDEQIKMIEFVLGLLGQ